jgi:excisionase family DNA binding protein
MKKTSINTSEKKLFSVKEAAEAAKVSEETIRRWIRSKKLRAIIIGKSFHIDPWELKILIEWGQDSQSDDFDLLSAALGLRKAIKGALLFDNAYSMLKTQFQRIKEDNLNLEAGLLRQNKELELQMAELNKWSQQRSLLNKNEKVLERPSTHTNNNYWQIPQKTLFIDIHFYFVAGALLDLSINKLQKDLDINEIKIIVAKYGSSLKDLNDARNDLEHIDERIERVSDLGNMSNGIYHFNGRNYALHFEKIEELRIEICDLLIRVAQEYLQSKK